MRVKDGDNYVLIGSRGGAPTHPQWVYNLRSDASVQIQDETEVYNMQVRELSEGEERSRLWDLAVEAFPPYAEYQQKTRRFIPVFLAEPV